MDIFKGADGLVLILVASVAGLFSLGVAWCGSKIKAWFVKNGYGKETDGPDRKV